MLMVLLMICMLMVLSKDDLYFSIELWSGKDITVPDPPILNIYVYSYFYYYYLVLAILPILSIALLWLVVHGWLSDIWVESYVGLTRAEQYSILIGIKLMILGELMLFSVCFWLLVNVRYSSNIFSFLVSIPLLNNYPFSIAWSNAIILQLSSLSIQSATIFIRCNNLIYTIESLGQSLFSGFLFMNLQQSEMLYSYYSLSFMVIGSIYYLTTGLHGLHVLFGCFGFFVIIQLL